LIGESRNLGAGWTNRKPVGFPASFFLLMIEKEIFKSLNESDKMRSEN